MGWSFIIKRYSKSWKRQRRIFTKHINPTTISTIHSRKQITAIHRLLRTLLSDSSSFREDITYASGSIVLGVAYGYDVKPKNDSLVELAQRIGEMAPEGLTPKYLVNLFPICKY